MDDFSVGVRSNLKGFKGKIIQGDIRRFNFKSLGKLDAIFHQAAITDTTVTNKNLMFSINARSLCRILGEAKQSGCENVIYASSAAIYGKGKIPMRESSRPAPKNIYGESKALAERIAADFSRSHPKMRIVGLRYFNVYGPRESHKGKSASMIYQLWRQIASGRRPQIFKWGEQGRDFIHVQDVVRANLLALSAKSGVYNAGTGRLTTFNEVIRILNRRLHSKRPTDYFDNPYGRFYQNFTQADMRRSASRLGFRALFSPQKWIASYPRRLHL